MDASDPIPLSALQHWAYCPRQCGLIHLEQAFDDNVHTLRGNALHAQVDQPGDHLQAGVQVARALPLWHDGLRLIGKADVVEFHADGSSTGQPFPVEYKQGSRSKSADIVACDELQLAAQAMCLEYMLNRAVPEAALFYASSKRRRVVPITPALREQVTITAEAVRDMLAAERLPAPLQGDEARRRCPGCSLHDRCQPEAAESTALERVRATLFEPDN